MQGGVPGNVLISNSFIYLDVIPVQEPAVGGSLLVLPAALAATRRTSR